MLQNHITLVKGQIKYYRDSEAKHPPGSPRYKEGVVRLYRDMITRHEELLAYLESLPAEPVGSPAPPQTPTGKPHLDDLPEELLAQLSTKATKAPADSLVQIVEQCGGIATLDDIIINLFRKTGEIGKRTIINNRVNRLQRDGMLFAVEGKKGFYSIKPPI